MSVAYDPHSAYKQRPANPERVGALSEHGGRRVLDVGCGNGTYVHRFAEGRDMFGADRHVFPTWTSGRFTVADAARLPFRDGAVDTVSAFETLEHLEDPAAALAEYHRVSTTNVVLTVPNCAITEGMRASNLIYHHWIDRTHRNFFDLDSITALVEAAGFNVVERRLVNRIELGPLFAEALRIPICASRFSTRVVRRLSRPYEMTCLVVGAKR